MNATETLAADYAALTAAAGLVDFSARTRIEIAGEDRASFLHNLCTNDIKGLAPGQGCEAFLCDARGHVLGHVHVFCLPSRLVIETVPNQEARLLAHFDKYHIREKISLHARTAETCAWLAAGPLVAEALAAIVDGEAPLEPLASVESSIAGVPATIVRMTMTSAGGWLIVTTAADAARLAAALQGAGVRPCGWPAFEVARLEIGTPFFGPDISDKNLPQEIARDAEAINFRKGCYLGQETVARIDALGHVNKRLVRVHFGAANPASPGAEVTRDGEVIGWVTSAARSPLEEKVFALAFLKRGHDGLGEPLECSGTHGIVTK